jgi:hypothetical protein
MIRNHPPGVLPGLGQMAAQLADVAADAAGQGAAAATQGLGKEVIRALYDILGAYPRANVLPYSYACSNTTAQGNAVGALATVENSIKISADAAFIATKITGTSTGDYLVSIRMAGSDRVLMNQAIHSAALVGTAERPSILPKPLLIQANSTVNMTYTDLSNASNEIYFTYIGFKVYDWQNYGPVASQG